MIGYVNRNVNPKNRKTGDCAIRAVATAAGIPYEVAQKMLFEAAADTCYDYADKKCVDKVLTKLGFVKHKQPKYINIYDQTKKYLVGEIDHLISLRARAVVLMANHYTAVVDHDCIDTWDCREKTIGNYWTKEE